MPGHAFQQKYQMADTGLDWKTLVSHQSSRLKNWKRRISSICVWSWPVWCHQNLLSHRNIDHYWDHILINSSFLAICLLEGNDAPNFWNVGVGPPIVHVLRDDLFVAAHAPQEHPALVQVQTAATVCLNFNEKSAIPLFASVWRNKSFHYPRALHNVALKTFPLWFNVAATSRARASLSGELWNFTFADKTASWRSKRRLPFTSCLVMVEGFWLQFSCQCQLINLDLFSCFRKQIGRGKTTPSLASILPTFSALLSKSMSESCVEWCSCGTRLNWSNRGKEKSPLNFSKSR